MKLLGSVTLDTLLSTLPYQYTEHPGLRKKESRENVMFWCPGVLDQVDWRSYGSGEAAGCGSSDARLRFLC